MYKEDPVKIQTYDIGSEEQTNNIIQSVDSDNFLPSDLVKSCKTIFSVAASENRLLSAYNARKKCFKICKKRQLDKSLYKTYVKSLQLNAFPDEFKKAELGKDYVKTRNLLIICSTSSAICFIIAISYLCIVIDAFICMNKWVHWLSEFLFTAIVFLIIATALTFAIRFFVRKLKETASAIKDIQ